MNFENDIHQGVSLSIDSIVHAHTRVTQHNNLVYVPLRNRPTDQLVVTCTRIESI